MCWCTISAIRSIHSCVFWTNSITEQKGDCLGVLGGVVDNDKDVLVPLGRLWEWTQQIHAHFLEGYTDDGQSKEWSRGWLPRGDALALRISPAEVMHFGFNTRPVKVVPQLFKGVASSQMASEQVGVGEVHHPIDLGAGNHQEVAHLASTVGVVVQDEGST